MLHTKILIMPSPVSTGSVGTVTKALAVARALRIRGCEVRFVMGGDLARLIARNGFSVASCPIPRPATSVQPIRNIVDFIQWTGLTGVDFVNEAIEAERIAIHDFHPDVIFAEARPTAAISSAIAHVPLVTIASWPMHPNFPTNQEYSEQATEVFNQQLRHYKLLEVKHVAELLFLRSDTKISPSLPELEPELQSIPGIHFVGYMLDTTYEDSQLPNWYYEWCKRPLPLIFIYLSVGAVAPHLYLKTIPETFKELPFNVLCACGFHSELHSQALPQAGENVRFVQFIPTQAIIKDTRLVIFHGGQDTMLTTLLHGLPSITIPGQHFERQYNAAQLASLGASKTLPVHAFRPQRLQQVVTEVLNGPYTLASQKLAQRLQTYGGTEQGVELILATAG